MWKIHKTANDLLSSWEKAFNNISFSPMRVKYAKIYISGPHSIVHFYLPILYSIDWHWGHSSETPTT